LLAGNGLPQAEKGHGKGTFLYSRKEECPPLPLSRPSGPRPAATGRAGWHRPAGARSAASRKAAPLCRDVWHWWLAHQGSTSSHHEPVEWCLGHWRTSRQYVVRRVGAQHPPYTAGRTSTRPTRGGGAWRSSASRPSRRAGCGWTAPRAGRPTATRSGNSASSHSAQGGSAAPGPLPVGLQRKARLTPAAAS